MSHKSDMLRIENLTVTYRGGFRAVDDLSLTVGCDESVALVGESGSGKSTTLRAVLGLLPARARTEGSIEIDEKPLHELGRHEMGVLQQQAGYVTQDPYSAYDPLRTVRHHVLEPLRARGRTIDEDAVLHRIETAGVPQAATRWLQHPHQWSGGMLQRADIIAATLLDPLITLADEPTSALDAELADDMMLLLRRQSQALLFVTHDLELASRHADRIIVLAGGRIVEQGATRTLLTRPTATPTIRLVDSVRERAESQPDAQTATGPIVVQASGATKRYRTPSGMHTAVDAADLTVRVGEIVGICGRSGSGKSTLLRLLGRLEEPDAGEVRMLTGPAGVLPIFQDPVGSLDKRWPIWRSITEPLLGRDRRGRGKAPSRRQRQEAARTALADVGLAHLDVNTFPGALSVGQCQRVAIARVACAAPPLVIADEPTASLDVTTAGEIAALLRTLRDRGCALVVVSHDVAFLQMVADRILRMEHGRLTAPADLADDSLGSAGLAPSPVDVAVNQIDVRPDHVHEPRSPVAVVPAEEVDDALAEPAESAPR